MIEYDKNAIVPDYITKWLRDNQTHNNELLHSMEEYARENHIPIAEPETASFLSVMTSIINPKSILEIGTAIGYSSIIMARAGKSANILSLEYNSDIIPVARENIHLAGLDDRITVCEADAKDYLSFLSDDESFDMIFLDGPKGHYYYMLDDCIRLLKKGGVLISDNVLYKGMTADDEHIIKRKETIVSRLRDYITALTNAPELKTSLLPLGDGVTISVKK